MRWESGWLYRLILKEVRKHWAKAIKEGEGKFGPAPAGLQILQFDGADWDLSICQGNIESRWFFDGKVVTLAPQTEQIQPSSQDRGMFFDFGEVRFHLAADRKRGIMSCVFGPRYGRGWSFRVEGQGAKGKLIPGEKLWVS